MTQEASPREFGPNFVLDLEDHDFTRNPYPTYRWMRENAPAYTWPERYGVVFCRYKDVKALYTDRRVSTDLRHWEFAQEEQWSPEHAEYKELIDHGLFRLDPGDHARVRKLVSTSLTPRSVEQMRTEIQRTVDEVLEGAIHENRLDVRAFAEALPLKVISDLLKIPEDKRAEFRAFALATVQATSAVTQPAKLFETIRPMPQWLAMLREVIVDRTRRPLDGDLLSSLITARDGGAKLSEKELVSLVHSLITAGSDTTVHATCWAIYVLLQHPDPLAQVRADPSLLRNAIEETLRFELFGKGGLPKICTEDMEVSGVALRKGQMVYPFVAAALRDPEAFPEPDRFDIHRDLSQTLAFGAGQHFCLGAALARMELDLGVGTLVQRYPRIKLLGEPGFEANAMMRAMTRLDVALSGTEAPSQGVE